MIFRYINLPVFLISFALGMFAVYITVPVKKKIIVYPSPDNHQYIQYKDKAENCFQVKETKSQCPKEGMNIFKIPIQAP